ncbi:hypothetical protein ACP70R_006349 [Stipagrostis hirtigluma subsp. patula]
MVDEVDAPDGACPRFGFPKLPTVEVHKGASAGGGAMAGTSQWRMRFQCISLLPVLLDLSPSSPSMAGWCRIHVRHSHTMASVAPLDLLQRCHPYGIPNPGHDSADSALIDGTITLCHLLAMSNPGHVPGDPALVNSINDPANTAAFERCSPSSKNFLLGTFLGASHPNKGRRLSNVAAKNVCGSSDNEMARSPICTMELLFKDVFVGYSSSEE